jgi:ankyrin repeat protein
MLINAGAIVDHKDKDGKTALEHAISNGHRGCAFALLRAGATLKTLPDVPGNFERAGSFLINIKLHAIKKCGGWQRHVELHRGRALRIVSACVGDALPDDVKGHVVDFWVPSGGN